MKYVRKAEWRRRIRAWNRSGLSARDFAAKLGVKEGTLRHWKWQLGYEGREGHPPVKRKRRAKFVEVIAPISITAPEPLELVLGNGMKLRVPAQFDSQSLRRVLEAIEAR